MDSTTGESTTSISSIATMTIAFVKTGILKVEETEIGQLYVADIGVPQVIFETSLGITWNPPYYISSLQLLYAAFTKDPLQEVIIDHDGEHTTWNLM